MLGLASFKAIETFEIAGVSWCERKGGDTTATASTLPGAEDFWFLSGSWYSVWEAIVG